MSNKKNVTSVNEVVAVAKNAAIYESIFSALKTRKQINTTEVIEYFNSTYPDLNTTEEEVACIMDVLYNEKVLAMKGAKFYNPATVKSTSRAAVNARITETPSEVSGKRISRTQAQHFMENNHGHFFTAKFITKKGKLRTINAQYLKDSTSELGYIKVREAGKMKKGEPAVRNVNLQTLEELTIGGKVFIVG